MSGAVALPTVIPMLTAEQNDELTQVEPGTRMGEVLRRYWYPVAFTRELAEWADLVVTMGCSVEEVCPRPMLAKMQKKLVDWDVEDPKGKTADGVRRIRDEIERRVADL